MRYLIFILSLFVLACGSPEEITFDNKYIDLIKGDDIVFEDGSSISMPTTDSTKIYYLIRHAEKDTSTSTNNPLLTEEGYNRSYRLAEIFKQTRIDQIYSTLYNRTLHTVDSLGNTKGLSTQIYMPNALKKVAQEMEDNVNAKRFVIVGHSDSTPAFSNVIMGEQTFEQGFDHSDYDNLVVIVKSPEKAKIYKLRYH